MFVAQWYKPLPEAISELMAVSFSIKQCLEGLDVEAFGDDRESLYEAFWSRLIGEYWSHYGGGAILLDGPDSWFGILMQNSGWGLQGRPWIRRPRATVERPDNGTLRAACLAAGWEEVPDDSLPRLRQEARG